MMREQLSRAILTMIAERGAGKSVCPSEIARAHFPEDWRRHMQEIRDIAVELHRNGEVVITQNGIPVDPDHLKGPIRITVV